MKSFLLPASIAAAMGLAGCDLGPQSGYGFTLPEGDPERGAKAFAELGCNGCHVVSGREDIGQPENAQLSIPLGGKVTTRVQTYGELVTSIVNPSHKLSHGFPSGMAESGESPMPVFNDVMTVSQLIDLVAFLQAQYELVPYQRTIYETFPRP
jgi:sulfur-oxidizing protein SoxX